MAHDVEISEPSYEAIHAPKTDPDALRFHYTARCHTCGWTSDGNEDRRKVERAAKAHVKKAN